MSCYSNSGFRAFDENDYFSVGAAGEISKCLLYIGYIEADYSFEISMSLLDKGAEELYIEAEKRAEEENREEFPEIKEFAVSVGSVTITVEST